MPTKQLARPVHSRGDGLSSPWVVACIAPVEDLIPRLVVEPINSA